MMRRLLSFAFALVLLPAAAFATAQAPDVLLYDHKVYDLYSNPLEAFYKEGASRPQFQVQPGTVSSGNWRGYTAIWEIEGEVLFLKGIASWICESKLSSEDCRKADLKELFGAKFLGGKVEAAWFSGELRIPDGKRLQYVHMGYGSVYEREILLTLQSGRITKKQVIDNTKSKIPSNLELQQRELEKLKNSPAGSRKVSP
jgi:hypothetical protein